jgi:hypothetical protein
MANGFENLGTHPPSKSEEEKTEGMLMHLLHSYAILSNSCQIFWPFFELLSYFKVLQRTCTSM